ncbi:MAG: hypothetical protein IVW54_12995 [Candidatus Binataceae bacterium]|nr:hypothetical protein [Candidatus Binataceae bacterium]
MKASAPILLREFVEQLHTLFTEHLRDDERWERIAALLPSLLNSPDLHASAKAWPEHAAGERPRNLLFYEDPVYRFVINGLIKKPHEGTPVHDHAHTWTVSGLMEGEERVVLYRRADDGSQPDFARLETLEDRRVGPGHVDVIAPYVIHEEHAGDRRTVSIIVRSERTGSFPQNMFHVISGKVTQAPGAGQFPYNLE